MPEIIDLGYRPRAAFVPFHKRTERWAALVCHRRAGKTVACIADLVDAALRCEKPNPRFAYIAPFYTQAKDVAWTYLKAMTVPIPDATINESELRADFPNGARVRLYGADNADRLRGLFLDGVVMDEFADMRPSVWGEIIRPALSDRQGWATFIGTPKGRNEFWSIYDYATRQADWFDMMLRADESGLLPDSELFDAMRMMTPEQYAQEYLCSFEAAITGAYYGKEIAEADRAGRICEIGYEPQLPVHTAWDIGVSDSTVIIWFQVFRGEIRVIDHYEAHGYGAAHYVNVIYSKPYKYGDHWLPHDVKVREWGTSRSRIETLQQLGLTPRLVPDHKEMDGINAGRLTLSICYFDRTRCADLLESMRQFRADFDEKTRAFRDQPKKDWTNHSADAFRYLAMAWREMAPHPPRPEPERRLNVNFVGGATFNDVVGKLGTAKRGEERV